MCKCRACPVDGDGQRGADGSVAHREGGRSGDGGQLYGTAAVDAGITEINGFEYTIKDSKKLEDEANQKAINDAKNKAPVLAKGFGVKIKKACSLKFTNSNNVSSYRLQSRMAKVATLAVANDENDSNSNDEIQSLDENINKPIDDQTVNEITGDSGELESEYVSLVIEQGDIARDVAEKLYEDGIINDVEAFRKYLGETGVSHTLHAGEYQIKVGATFEEIVEVLK